MERQQHQHDGTSATITGLTSGKTYEVQVRATNDEGDSSWSATGKAVTQAGGVSRSVAENSAAGTNVGAAVTAKANAGYTYSYSLGGTDESKFEIGSATGQITVKTGTSLDYETKTSYSVTVKVAVAQKLQGASVQTLDPNVPGNYTIPVTINVTDVNEPPQFNGATGHVFRSGEHGGGNEDPLPPRQRRRHRPGGRHADLLAHRNGRERLQRGLRPGEIDTKSALDYESKTSYSVTLNVSDKKDKDGNADNVIDDTIALTIRVTDVNEPPAAPAAPSVSANSGTPTSKIDVSWSAPTMTGKPAITDYDVQYRLAGGSTWTDASFTGATTSTTLTGLTEGKTYEVQVRATNDEGTSGWSDSAAAP